MFGIIREVFSDYNLGLFSDLPLYIALFNTSFATFKCEETFNHQKPSDNKQRVYGELRFKFKVFQ